MNRIRIGYPIDAAREKFAYVLVKSVPSKNSFVIGGQSSLLRNESGAWHSKRLAELSIPFSKIPNFAFLHIDPLNLFNIGYNHLSPENITTNGDSDGAACALACAGYDLFDFEKDKDTPIILISCSIFQRNEEDGYYGLTLKPVTDKQYDDNKNLKSLENKWKATLAATKEYGGALVLHKEDADLLIKSDVFKNLKTDHCEALTKYLQKGFLQRYPILVAVSDDEMPFLAECLGIHDASKIFGIKKNIRQNEKRKFLVIKEKEIKECTYPFYSRNFLSPLERKPLNKTNIIRRITITMILLTLMARLALYDMEIALIVVLIVLVLISILVIIFVCYESN